MIIYNLILTFRRLKKNKLHSILGILSFTIGFAICLTIGLYLYNELTVDTCFEKHEQIYRMINFRGQNINDNVYIDYKDINIFLDNFPEISAICPIELNMKWNRPLKTEEKSLYMTGFITTNNSFFDIFSVPVIESLSENPFMDIHSAVITESASKNLFGTNNPLGKQITLDDNKELFISAIIGDFPVNASIKANIILNAENQAVRASHCGDGKGGWYYSPSVYILLNKNTSAKELTKKINDSIDRLGTREKGIKLQALTDIYLGRHVDGSKNKAGSILMILMFSAISILILFLSIINHINFNLSLQLTKLKEIGIKKTSGAQFGHLLVHQFTEIFIWIILAFIGSLLLVESCLPVVNQLFDQPLDISKLFLFPYIIYTCMSLVLIAVITGFAPIYILSKFDIRSFISGKLAGSNKYKVKKWLTTAQFTVSIILVVGVIIIQQQIHFVKQKDIGFNEDYLLWLKLPVNYQSTQPLKNQLLQYSAIQSASISRGNPGDIRSTTSDKDNSGREFLISRIDVDDSFLNTIGLKLLDGRNFLSGDRGRACLINETALKKYGWETFENRKCKEFDVIGVVNDFHVSSMHSPINGVCLVFDTENPSTLNLRIHPENIGTTLEFIRSTWYKISPYSPLDLQFYDEYFDAMYRSEERLSKSINLFAIIAIIITGLGLLGQSFFICINRTKEIGIRKVLGASVSGIVVMLSKDFTRFVFLANLFAWPIAWLVMKLWLQNFAYRTHITIWPFLLAGFAALMIALLTVSWQSIKAATANPVESLRYE
jgi:putative ABC transport system permease protein